MEQKREQKKLTRKNCSWCGSYYMTYRDRDAAQYCTDSCKMRAYRWRKFWAREGHTLDHLEPDLRLIYQRHGPAAAREQLRIVRKAQK